jgi:hypothetical protein
MKGRRLPDTTLSRSIIIELKRKRRNERVRHFKNIDDPELQELRQQARRWALDNGDTLKGAEPEMPEGFDNRLGDNWRLQFAIADLAGGEWPELARQAAQQLSAVVSVASVGVRLLAAIKTAFDDHGELNLPANDTDAMSSADLIKALTEEPDSEWAEWKSGKPLSPNQLARLLKPFGMAPQPIRVRTVQVRGYLRGQFTDAWERYL